jgi:hypothetical protein
MEAVDPVLVDTAEDTLRHVPRVAGAAELWLRGIGHQLCAEVTITVDASLSLWSAHQVAVDAEHTLLHAVPRLTAALIHPDPTRTGKRRPARAPRPPTRTRTSCDRHRRPTRACSKRQSALSLLDGEGAQYTVRRYPEKPPTEQELEEALRAARTGALGHRPHRRTGRGGVAPGVMRAESRQPRPVDQGSG